MTAGKVPPTPHNLDVTSLCNLQMLRLCTRYELQLSLSLM